MKQILLITALFITQLGFGQACKMCYSPNSTTCFDADSVFEAQNGSCPVGTLFINVFQAECHPTACTLTSFLPIELAEFSGEVTNGAVLLTWKTATEKNSQSFDVEKSSNGLDWSFIASVESNKNSSTVSTYNLLDRGIKQDKYYYRIKSIDQDDSVSYSQVIEVNLTDARNPQVKSYPNPVTDYLVIENLAGKVAFYNIKGNVVLEDTITDSTQPSIIHLGNLSKGIYVVEITNENGKVYSQKVIKQ